MFKEMWLKRREENVWCREEKTHQCSVLYSGIQGGRDVLCKANSSRARIESAVVRYMKIARRPTAQS